MPFFWYKYTVFSVMLFGKRASEPNCCPFNAVAVPGVVRLHSVFGRGLIGKTDVQIGNQSNLQQKDNRHAVSKLHVQCFVVPHFHAQPSADAAARSRQKQQSSLGDAPLCAFCLEFVDAVHQKRSYVDGKQICQCDVPRLAGFLF